MSEQDTTARTRYRTNASDPFFAYLLGMAISLGLTPILPQEADLRFVLAWAALAGVSVLAWLLGSFDRIGQETLDNLLWGVGFGLLFSVPFLLFFSDTFYRVVRLAFPNANAGVLLAYVLFVMPLAETLFFRGLLQKSAGAWVSTLFAGVWQIVLFLPVMWVDVLRAPAVGVFLAVAFMTMSGLYAYVRQRNSLAAAWICQIVTGFILFFVPSL